MRGKHQSQAVIGSGIECRAQVPSDVHLESIGILVQAFFAELNHRLFVPGNRRNSNQFRQQCLQLA